jgi:predicted heme/steroid binding protein
MLQYHILLLILFGIVSARKNDANKRLFSKEELAKFKGQEDDTPIYLSIFGEVYDVTNGTEFYGKGSGYSFFAGVDGTVSFFTGNFTEEALSDNSEILAFKDEEISSMYQWKKFYEDHEVYEFKGFLIGDFYDSNGLPTKYLKDIIARVEAQKNEKEL